MGCKQSKPKGGTHSRPTRPVASIPNAPQVSHRPPPQRRPQPQRQQQQRYQPVAQHHWQDYADDDGPYAYDAPVSSHQQQQKQQNQQQQGQQKHNPYANDQEYKLALGVTRAVGKVGANVVTAKVGPKYGDLLKKGAEEAESVARNGVKWKQKAAEARAQREQQQQQGGAQGLSQGQAAGEAQAAPMGEKKYGDWRDDTLGYSRQ